MQNTSTLTYHSPLGALTLHGDGHQLQRLEFPNQVASATPGSDDDVILALAASQLDEYFAGERRRFELPLAPQGTRFQQRVWELLQQIPYGQTTSYGQLAIALEARHPGERFEPRAVAGAVARTPIPIIIPCHRVIGADGSLRGYRGGLERKRELLERESAASGGGHAEHRNADDHGANTDELKPAEAFPEQHVAADHRQRRELRPQYRRDRDPVA